MVIAEAELDAFQKYIDGQRNLELTIGREDDDAALFYIKFCRNNKTKFHKGFIPENELPSQVRFLSIMVQGGVI